MSKYLQIQFADGCFCVCEDREEVEVMTEGCDDGYTVKEIEMTPEEFDALPEFEG